ncbi:retron St85 family RNA-directed DNA polymerase [Comamonas sp.]|uniref:retron St85 family RNA-directed DNA polymerase n=1 Tax=Comamonas sp. TaxID=34028 RepID=UPI00289E10C8|nr:retron St85 family RNA-directed DNA polymerase [Comamonas sp.]
MLNRIALLQKMSSDLAMLPTHLEKIIKTAPLRYKNFEIPKKSGGVRQVAQPAREVKAIQRWFVREIGLKLPIHKSATAYSKGSSIRFNAEAHVSSRFMLKLDFKDFFPSILEDDIKAHFNRYLSQDMDESAQSVLAHVCCWAPDRQIPLRLCIGAPSSPIISNSIMFDFDSKLSDFAEKDEVVYTRYADDITLSARDRGKIEKYTEIVKNLLIELQHPKLQLNTEKTVRASRAGRRIITGITITPEQKLSIGRDRKRIIRAMYHRSLSENFNNEKRQILEGLLAFADNIEPGFSQRLKKSNHT